MTSSSWEILRSENTHTVVVLLCSLVAFWPFLAGYHVTDLESSILRTTLNEQSIKEQSAAVALALLVPLILDWMADLLGPWFGVGRKKNADDVSTINNFQKGCLFLGLAIVPCMAYVSTEYDSLALLWFCLSRFQVVLVLGLSLIHI